MKNNKFVYHGPPREFDSDQATSKRNIRTKQEKNPGSRDVIFDRISFHVTPHKWIALAYACKPAPVQMGERTTHYNMGVDLYDHTKEIEIFGRHSLEESLKVLYGGGGYLYYFDKNKFTYKEGLGNLEVISEKPLKPIKVERIDDPVAELKKLGTTFKFIDLSLPKNEKYQNYW